MSDGGRFLARWSRLKKAAEKASTAAGSGEALDGEALLAALGPDSDFGQFLRQEISEEVRRQAMKTLFSDPHFNVMDGLDTYIDDYSLSDPIPEEMLAMLNQAKTLFGSDEKIDPDTQPETPAIPAESATPAVPPCDILAAGGQNVAAADKQLVPASENQ